MKILNHEDAIYRVSWLNRTVLEVRFSRYREKSDWALGIGENNITYFPLLPVLNSPGSDKVDIHSHLRLVKIDY
jgi:hypothetical protein